MITYASKQWDRWTEDNQTLYLQNIHDTVYPKKYAHGFCFAVLCCGYTLTDFPISIRLTSLALWQSNDCPNASKATLMNMDKYFMWIHYERLHNHNKANHNKTVCIFLGIYCILPSQVSNSMCNMRILVDMPVLWWGSMASCQPVLVICLMMDGCRDDWCWPGNRQYISNTM